MKESTNYSSPVKVGQLLPGLIDNTVTEALESIVRSYTLQAAKSLESIVRLYSPQVTNLIAKATEGINLDIAKLADSWRLQLFGSSSDRLSITHTDADNMPQPAIAAPAPLQTVTSYVVTTTSGPYQEPPDPLQMVSDEEIFASLEWRFHKTPRLRALAIRLAMSTIRVQGRPSDRLYDEAHTRILCGEVREQVFVWWLTSQEEEAPKTDYERADWLLKMRKRFNTAMSDRDRKIQEMLKTQETG